MDELEVTLLLTIAYTPEGRIKAVSTSQLSSPQEVRATRAALTNVLMSTDQLLEQAIKNDAAKEEKPQESKD